MNRLKVTIDRKSGFCFGVINATKLAEEVLARGETLYCLGDLVHNSAEIIRMRKLGLVTIDRQMFESLKNVTVLFRAHGEPPLSYEIAKKNNITVIDATCPVVLKLQQRVRESAALSAKNGGTVVLFGKRGHAEVEGLLGQTKNSAIVVSNKDEIKEKKFDGNVILFSQTTMGKEAYDDVAKEINSRLDSAHSLKKINSICGQVSRRIPAVIELALANDVVIFVSGKKSSNGKMLYDKCLSVNSLSYFVSEPSELQTEWFTNAVSVGICGATSTPVWQLEEMAEAVKSLNL